MTITKLIRTEEEYDLAIERMEEIFDAKNDTPEGDELDLLILVISAYEDIHYQIDDPDPIEAIKFRMEQEGLSQTDLAKVIGYKSRVSEILSRKRKLNLDMIRKLSEALSIPTDVLVTDYDLG
jgi:HTH-type transcriptional regulator/antitoxin HigA